MARTSRRTRRNSPLHLPGAFDLFTPSRELVLKNIWIFGPLYAVMLIFSIHSWLWSPVAGQHVPWWHHGIDLAYGSPGSSVPTYCANILVGFSKLWFLIIVLGGTVAQIMAQAAQLDAVEHRVLDFQLLWRQVRRVFWRMIGLYLVMFVVIGVGLFLLIVPGVILIRRYLFAPYILIEKNVSILDALDQSARLSRVNPGSIYGVIGVLFLIALIGVIPFVGGLVSFAVGGLYSVAPALRYQQLKRIKGLA